MQENVCIKLPQMKNTGVEENKHLNIDQNFDRQRYLSKRQIFIFYIIFIIFYICIKLVYTIKRHMLCSLLRTLRKAAHLRAFQIFNEKLFCQTPFSRARYMPQRHFLYNHKIVTAAMRCVMILSVIINQFYHVPFRLYWVPSFYNVTISLFLKPYVIILSVVISVSLCRVS